MMSMDIIHKPHQQMKKEKATLTEPNPEPRGRIMKQPANSRQKRETLIALGYRACPWQSSWGGGLPKMLVDSMKETVMERNIL